MNPNIQALFDIAKKPERTIVGLMSGTSLDGLDIALCKTFRPNTDETSGKLQVKLLNFTTVEYSQDIKDKIRAVFAKSQVDLQYLCLLNAWLGTLHGEMINQTLRKWNISADDVDVIASHGQTVFHAPMSFHQIADFPNATLQIGDGDHVAVKTGIITLSDFRQKHIAAGGEGAPLALYGDYLLFCDKTETRVLLNIGGIANFTYLPARDLNGSSGRPLSTDTGPGNTLIDAYMKKLYGQDFDENGNVARSGRIETTLLKRLKSHGFFSQSFPKTTGPESFSMEYVYQCQLDSNTSKIGDDDLIATLTRFTAETIAEAILRCLPEQGQGCDGGASIYTSGGGSHNKTLQEHLQSILTERQMSFAEMDALGVPGDAKEAVLFAVLADEALCGDPCACKGNLGSPAVSMGKISFPN